MPIDGGVVDAEGHVVTVAGIGEALDDVAFVRGTVDNVVGGLFSGEHIEAIVVFGGKDDELHARIFSQANDAFGIPLRGIELAGQCSVSAFGNMGVGLNLFAVVAGVLLTVPNAAECGEQTEVNEHAVFAALPLVDGGGVGARR